MSMEDHFSGVPMGNKMSARAVRAFEHMYGTDRWWKAPLPKRVRVRLLRRFASAQMRALSIDGVRRQKERNARIKEDILVIIACLVFWSILGLAFIYGVHDGKIHG